MRPIIPLVGLAVLAINPWIDEIVLMKGSWFKVYCYIKIYARQSLVAREHFEFMDKFFLKRQMFIQLISCLCDQMVRCRLDI